MSQQPTSPPDLRARLRAVWASGDYPSMAEALIPDLGARLVEAVRVAPGERVLDVAAGAGNAAIPAAATGASVVASDITPELFEAGRAAAAARGVEVDWQEADAAALPDADDSYDVVLSCIGVMFAPFHQQSADELVRVTRPGGRIGLLSWTPDGFIGQLFAATRPFAPPPPPGAQPPPLWGTEGHVRELLGDRVEVETLAREHVEVDRFGSGEAFRDYFKAGFGPTIMAYRHSGEDPERVAELDRALAELGDRFLAGGSSMNWEYLLLVARKH